MEAIPESTKPETSAPETRDPQEVAKTFYEWMEKIEEINKEFEKDKPILYESNDKKILEIDESAHDKFIHSLIQTRNPDSRPGEQMDIYKDPVTGTFYDWDEHGTLTVHKPKNKK